MISQSGEGTVGTVSGKEEEKFTKAEDEEIICWKDLTVELSKDTHA